LQHKNLKDSERCNDVPHDGLTNACRDIIAVFDTTGDQAKVIARQDRSLKKSVMNFEQAQIPRAIAETNFGNSVAQEMLQTDRDLPYRLDKEHAWIHRITRKVPCEDWILRQNRTRAPDSPLLQIDLIDAVDEKKGRAVRQHPLDGVAAHFDTNCTRGDRFDDGASFAFFD
jgi:hypothetical protein